MATSSDSISPDLVRWIEAQHVFFVASSPLSSRGHVNCSPKGMNSFRVLTHNEVAYLDLTGSGAETIAHLKENGRIVFMFCAFEGAPKIVRLHGLGRVAEPGSAEFDRLRGLFDEFIGTRAIIVATITRVSDSCGFAVPRMTFAAERDALQRWAEKKGPEGLAEYRRHRNARSIDGLPALGTRPT